LVHQFFYRLFALRGEFRLFVMFFYSLRRFFQHDGKPVRRYFRRFNCYRYTFAVNLFLQLKSLPFRFGST
jgi:hypothetical protein